MLENSGVRRDRHLPQLVKLRLQASAGCSAVRPLIECCLLSLERRIVCRNVLDFGCFRLVKFLKKLAAPDWASMAGVTTKRRAGLDGERVTLNRRSPRFLLLLVHGSNGASFLEALRFRPPVGRTPLEPVHARA